MDVFNKKFFFTSNSKWKLPDSFQSPSREKCHNRILISTKRKLNLVKAKTGEFDLDTWSSHTKSRDPSQRLMERISKEFKPELLTQAWMKFYEIVCSFQVVTHNELRTLHLCEAPGAFIAALNHFLASNYYVYKLDYLACTLNPYYPDNNLKEMIDYDRLIVNTSYNWIFGDDDSGNIKNFNNYLSIVGKVNEKLGQVNLITADGSVNCIDDPENQEKTVAHLLYCEILTAISVLAIEGTLIFKMFTMFEPVTISLIYLINCTFKYVTAFKPFSSKAGNSEIYFICQHFKGVELLNSLWPELFDFYKNPDHFHDNFELDPPSEFIDIIGQCAEFFATCQINAIEDNLATFNATDSSDKLSRFVTNWCNYFITTKCKISAIDLKYFVVKSQDDHLYQKYYRAMQKNANCFTKYGNFFFIDSNKSVEPMIYEIIVGRKYHTIRCSKFVERFNDSLNIVANFSLDNDENVPNTTYLINCMSFYNTNDFHAFEVKCLQAIVHHLEALKNLQSTHADLIIKNFVPLTYFSVNILYVLRSQFKYFGCDPYNKEFIFQTYQNNDDQALEKLQQVLTICGETLNVPHMPEQINAFLSAFPAATREILEKNRDRLKYVPYETTVVRFLSPKTVFLNDQIRLIKMYNKFVFRLNKKRKYL